MICTIVKNLTENTPPETMIFFEHSDPNEFKPGDTFERFDRVYKIIAAAPLEPAALKLAKWYINAI
jgi:hypothetical protein